MELFIILGLTILVLSFSIICVIDIIRGNELESNFFIYTLFVYSFIVFLLSVYYTTKPRAIDVYTNRTTLEITYKDKVPIDSTVVWKSK